MTRLAHLRPGWALLLGLGVLLGGCLADLESAHPTTGSDHPLEGRWRVEAVEVESSCAALEVFGSVEVSTMSLQRRGGAWSVESGGDRLPMREIGPDVLRGRVDFAARGCSVAAEVEWEIRAVGPTGFGAFRRTAVTLSGRDCEAPVRACTLTHVLRGSR
jgi:hypothetical protein